MINNSDTPAARLGLVRSRIEAAEKAAGRPAGSVALLAVSKTRPADDIRQCAAAGQSRFGENYLKEALEKIEKLSDLALEWHFIGPIQSNKTAQIASNFAWVHSVDRIKIAQRLNDQRPDGMPALNVCLQVNVSGEATKSGCTPEALPDLVRTVRDLPRLQLRGLMAIPAPSPDPAQQRTAFRILREARDRLNQELDLRLDTLSMGMSDDLEAAIAEGATIVRVGTALFGPRPRHGQNNR